MLRILLLAVLVTLLVIFWSKFRSLPPSEKHTLVISVATWTTICIVSTFFITGRFYLFPMIIGLGMGVYFFISKKSTAINIASKASSFLKKLKSFGKNPDHSNAYYPAQNILDQDTLHSMSVLGITGICFPSDLTEELVQNAYRKAISENHPDRGGDVELAAQINLARDNLILLINKTK